MKKKILSICSIVVMSFGVMTSTAAAEAKCPPHHATRGAFAFDSQTYSFTHSYVEYVDANGKSHEGICSVRVYDKMYKYNCTDCGEFLYYGADGQRYEHSNCSQR